MPIIRVQSEKIEGLCGRPNYPIIWQTHYSDPFNWLLCNTKNSRTFSLSVLFNKRVKIPIKILMAAHHRNLCCTPQKSMAAHTKS